MTDPTIAGNTDPVQAALQAASRSLVRRGYFTTEWWTTIIGGALSAALALMHIKASSATHVVAVAAPAILAAIYAVTRTMHKSALASALADVFPQAGGGGAAAAAGGQTSEPATADQVKAGPLAQTDPEFAFVGISQFGEADG
jgi:hypothetical protein